MSDHSKLSVPMPADRRSRTDTRDQRHQTHEWASGTRGGGKLPADLEWNTNPKQWQEEHGSAVPEKVKPESVPALPPAEKK